MFILGCNLSLSGGYAKMAKPPSKSEQKLFSISQKILAVDIQNLQTPKMSKNSAK